MSIPIFVATEAAVGVLSYFIGMMAWRMTVVSTRQRASRELRTCVMAHIEEREAKAKAENVSVVWTRHEQELLDSLYNFQVQFDDKTWEITPWIAKKIEDFILDSKAGKSV